MTFPLRTTWFVVVLLIAAVIVLVALASGAPAQGAPPPTVTTKPAPATPIDVKKAELGSMPWNPQWDRIIERDVPRAMLSSRVPRDVRRFCPRFYFMNKTNRRAFWAYFFQALAGVEAGLNPATVVPHTAPGAAPRARMERHATQGLLQLSYADHERYGCHFNQRRDRRRKPDDPARSILQPKNNLGCGVKILDDQIITRHQPLLDRSSYWSPLRPGEPGNASFLRQMANPPAACGLPARSAVSRSATTLSVAKGAKSDMPSR